MSIHFDIHTHIEGETSEEALAEFRRVFGALVGATPAVAGVAAAGVDLVTAEANGDDKDVEVISPALNRIRKSNRNKKDKVETGEAVKTDPLADASNAEKTESASTSSTTETSSPSASGASSVSIDDLRAKLMALSKTDGGHDEVFTILGKFGAKNASTVPEAKRGEVVALVDEALAEVK